MSKKLNGYLDHLRDNLETLDEQIVNARKMSKPGRKGADKAAALQWAKTLRDLVELRNTTLLNVKTHLLGRDETGSPNEPHRCYKGNQEVEFERAFQKLLSPWTKQDLKLQCEDCGKESEEVSTRRFPHQYKADELFDLCDKCYEKRTTKDTDESEEDSEASDPVSILKEFAETQGGENAGSSRNATALAGVVRNVIRALALDGTSSVEKAKTLEQFKDDLIRTAFSSASGQNIDPGVALLDKEIERLRKEADLGKGQDAAGKPAT